MADINGIPAATDDKATPSDDPINRQIDIALEAQDGPSTETSNTETQSGEAKPKEGEATPSNDKQDSSSSDSNDKSQQPANKEGTQEARPTHTPKDLTLPDGTVVKGGAERRFFEQREVARQQANTFKQQLDAERSSRERVEGELRTLRETAQQLNGVDPNTLRIGAQIVKDLQSDPVGTMKKLLAEVVAQGHTIESIGAGVDTLAMQRLIDSRLPQQQTEAPSEEQLLQEAQQEVTNFYSSYPDARPHDAILARMLRDNPGVDLNTAYFELKNAFIDKGFDWSRTLEDNLKDTSSPNNTQQQSQHELPLPGNGRAPASGMAPADEVKIAHEDTDMGDIVRQAMRESGLKV